MAPTVFPSCPPTLDSVSYENICRCQGVGVAQKRLYLAAIASCGTDADCAASQHRKECTGKGRKGRRLRQLLPDEGLGALVEETVFIKYTAKDFGMSVSQFRTMLEQCLSYYEKRDRGATPTESERLSVFSLLRATVPARGDGSIWMFRNPDKESDAYTGIENEWLGHRLGLNVAASGETRLTLGFFAAHVQDPRRPTYCDVTWNFLPLWDWKGRTKPLAGTPTRLNGLHEAVAVPPELHRLNRPVRRLKLAKRHP